MFEIDFAGGRRHRVVDEKGREIARRIKCRNCDWEGNNYQTIRTLEIPGRVHIKCPICLSDDTEYGEKTVLEGE